MIYFIISLLVASQVYLLFKVKSLRSIPKESKIDKRLILEPIPKDINYDDIDTNYSLIFDTMESIKLEEWHVRVMPDYESYDIEFLSNNDIRVEARLRMYEGGDIRLSWFRIRNPNMGYISIDNATRIKNDVIYFLWGYIIEYHNDKNNERSLYYKNMIDAISNKLVKLNRDKRLKDILR